MILCPEGMPGFMLWFETKNSSRYQFAVLSYHKNNSVGVLSIPHICSISNLSLINYIFNTKRHYRNWDHDKASNRNSVKNCQEYQGRKVIKVEWIQQEWRWTTETTETLPWMTRKSIHKLNKEIGLWKKTVTKSSVNA